MPLTSCFNSRPYCDGRQTRCRWTFSGSFQFTPVLRRATRLRATASMRFIVSIHARLATGDTARRVNPTVHSTFQFTPVLRRATQEEALRKAILCFNSRPSCDGRLSPGPSNAVPGSFNSRPYCDGRHTLQDGAAQVGFQFTPVLRRATRPDIQGPHGRRVSIHARLATGDRGRRPRRSTLCSFNSRPYCDGRRLAHVPNIHRLVSIHARLATGDR